MVSQRSWALSSSMHLVQFLTYLFFLFRNSGIKMKFQILEWNPVARACAESQGDLLSKLGRSLWLFASANVLLPITLE